MVDLVVLQSVSYIAAATGVCIAALYYAMNLREANKNRKIAYTNTVMQYFLSEESVTRWVEITAMSWTDFNDFKNKYDSRVNPESYGKRLALWLKCDNLGYLYKANLIDIDTVFNIGGLIVETAWAKFKPIIEGYRGTDFSSNSYKNWEYVAEAVSKKRKEQNNEVWEFMDSLWKGSEYR
jgi:hypothetical protein